MKLKLLVSPLAKGAFFKEYMDVAVAELHCHFPLIPLEPSQMGGLDFIAVDVPDDALPHLTRLSSIQGIFKVTGDDALIPLAADSNFQLPEQLVYGWKYQGKTNEMITQMAINVALRYWDGESDPKTLLDPMAGKGTTLLWASRYGLNSVGVEQDASALSALEAHLKKQAKLLRLKHSLTKGSVGPRSKGNRGKFLLCEMNDHSLRLVTGDSRETPALLGGQRFDVIVCDLPYGVQFKGGPKRSPLETVKESAGGWMDSLRSGGAMVLIYNTYQPAREQLMAVFKRDDCTVHPFSAAHRMSESIVRDFLVVTRN